MALHSLLGISRFPVDDTIRNLFKHFGQGQCQRFFSGLWRWQLEQLSECSAGYSLDLDSMVFERYGQQQRALRGLRLTLGVRRGIVYKRCKWRIGMASRTRYGFLLALLTLSPALYAQSTSGPDPAAQNKNFDAHDLNGSWLGTQKGVGDVNPVPEPPLTSWAKEHLLTKSISHAGLNETSKGGSSTQSTTVGAVDENGVPANVEGGIYPGQMCEPEGAPVQFNYTNLYPIQFIILPDRIYQMFENHNEWRKFWLNRDHPQNVFHNYFGDSVAKWDGDTLVVDTIGFNGREWISENIGQHMSDAFHLVERYHLTDATHLTLEMTYYDPKAWGDKAWPGWKKEFKQESKGDSLIESVCDPAHEREFDDQIEAPARVTK